jgi:hypothetical protein
MRKVLVVTMLLAFALIGFAQGRGEMTMEAFCKFYEITEDQFKGAAPIRKHLRIDGESVPAGFNPVMRMIEIPNQLTGRMEYEDVRLDMPDVKLIPEGFNPVIEGVLDIRSVENLPKDFNPKVRTLAVNGAALPEGFSLDMNCTTLFVFGMKLPKGFAPKVKDKVTIAEAKEVPEGFKPETHFIEYLDKDLRDSQRSGGRRVDTDMLRRRIGL